MNDNLCQTRATAKRRAVATTAMAFIAITLTCSRVLADGGTLRLNETAGPYRLSVFTSPSPPRAGRVDVSVLVQDASTGAIVPDAKLSVRIAPIERPEVVRSYVATHEAATNKLLLAAECELPMAGIWRFEVSLEGLAIEEHTATRHVASPRVANDSATFTLEVGEPLSDWWDMAPWIGWPALAIGLFGIHNHLAMRTGPKYIKRI